MSGSPAVDGKIIKVDIPHKGIKIVQNHDETFYISTLTKRKKLKL